MAALATYRRVSDKVGVLQLDDGQANAFSFQMLKDVYTCLVQAEKDLLECKGALVIAGNARALSSGFDLNTMMEGIEKANDLVNAGGTLVERLLVFPRPVVVAATGHAVAFGAFVLLTGDYRLGAQTVNGKPLKVGLNETANGMNMPDFFAEGARTALARQYLRESVALGLIFDAGRAQQVGFLDEAVPHDQVLAAAQKKAEELASWCKHPAFQYNKKLLLGPMASRITEGRRHQNPEDKLRWLKPVSPSKL
eukprot:TRINITY_DN27162_c0_g1_i1.p1 TRINITY_DN27162_c0_g1~~TRINITY_DN27162_c0_g1_i1.p1  ORF type:complete len:252 (-),score=61.95 TRINITY_DN27162_c0_g1_i1:331-1086(-)